MNQKNMSYHNNDELYSERIQAFEQQGSSLDFVNSLSQKILFKTLRDIKKGYLEIYDGNDNFEFGDKSADTPHVKIKVNQPDFYSSVILGGSLGVSESYMVNQWECSSITDLTRLFLINRERLDAMDSGPLTWTKNIISFLYHQFKRNSLTGSRKNIAAHYDLGNDFFEKMLDDTMSYSSAVFKDENTSLRDASIEKLDLICRKLSLNKNDHLLEIGTGWGGLAIHAAKNYQCKVTSVTISKEQYEYAIKKIEDENLQNLITVELKDYRKIEGQYSKLVSVEMIEAVGHQYYSEFFATCSRLVKPDGMFLLQAITIDDRYYDLARKSVDFIKKYIFPGCCIPSMATISKHIKKDTDYQLYHMQDISLDYAKTLNLWNQNFQANKDDIQKLGYDDNFCRMWEYYLQYCEGGFLERAIGDVQLIYVKKDTRNITFDV